MKQNIMTTTKNISFSYVEAHSPEEMEKEDHELLLAAQQAAISAYAPYSGFKVGAAVRLSSGLIVSGSNVENAAFPSGICAERNALSNASSNHPGDFPSALAVAALTGTGLTPEPVSPCGNCRQVLAEEEMRSGKNIRIILGGKKKIQIIGKAGDLLPLQFSREDLKVSRH